MPRRAALACAALACAVLHIAVTPRRLVAQPAGHTTATIARLIVVDGDTVRLGQPLGAAAKWVAVTGDTLVRVPPEYVDADADGLLIVRDPLGPVTRFALLYQQTRNIDALVGEYMRDFGRGAAYTSAPVPEGVRENWTWTDGASSLTFVRFTPAQNGIAAIRVITNMVP